jgi:hypothetical protein
VLPPIQMLIINYQSYPIDILHIFMHPFWTVERGMIMGNMQESENRRPAHWWFGVVLFGAAMFNLGILMGALF